jgi:2-oxoglutarate dehydrogenase E2 component (dihydrolipoamide succinyltransferase)
MSATQLVDVLAPADSQEGTRMMLQNWLRQPGDIVAENDPIVELETDKVAMEVPAPIAGELVELIKQPGEEVGPGELLGRMRIVDQRGADVLETNDAVDTENTAPPLALSQQSHVMSPAVRRLVAQHAVDISVIPGTGKGGRVTREDVVAFVGQVQVQVQATSETEVTEVVESVSQPAPIAVALPQPHPVLSAPNTTGKAPHSNMRRSIAEHMVRSLNTAPHVTAVFELDFTAVSKDRAARKAQFEAQGVKLTYTAYFVAACVAAMQRVPQVNSRWHDDGLELFGDINIGIGTALGDSGLVVPVIHQAQSLNLFGIAQRLQDVTTRAKQGKLAPTDVKGGTFSISNHGTSGSLIASPIIINQPQSAILGVGKLEKRAVVREYEGQDVIVIKPMAFVSLSIDHRVLDGFQTNLWLSTFVEHLENWKG